MSQYHDRLKRIAELNSDIAKMNRRKEIMINDLDALEFSIRALAQSIQLKVTARDLLEAGNKKIFNC